jgi:hypothetical protein
MHLAALDSAAFYRALFYCSALPRAVLCSTGLCCAVHYCAVLCSTVLYCAVLCCALLCCDLLASAVLYGALLLYSQAMTWGMHSIGYLDTGDFELAAKYFNMSFQVRKCM